MLKIGIKMCLNILFPIFFSFYFVFNYYLSIFAEPALAESPLWGKARVGDIYIKGVTVRFGFDVLRTWKIQMTSQKQSNGDALWGVYTLHPEHFL